MKTRNHSSVVAALALLAIAGTAPVARALPANQTVTYTIHTDPEDTNSAVRAIYSFELSAVSQNGYEVTWDVISATISMPGDGLSWASTNVSVDTRDGLWHVVHADPDHPAASEFVAPAMSGTAAEVTSSAGDATFSLSGSWAGGGNPILLTSLVQYVATSEQIDDEDGTPVNAGNDH
jgi:hypothetical protein